MTKAGKNPTTNCTRDSHEKFCERCFAYNKGRCPDTGKKRRSKYCHL